MSAESGAERATRLPVVIGAAVIAALLIAYYLYVRDQRAYFSSRNRRLLATLGRQLDGMLASQQSFVRNYAHSRRAPVSFVRQIRSIDPPHTTPDPYLPDFDAGSRDCLPAGAFPLVAQAGGEIVSSRLIEERGTTWLRIEYTGAVPEVRRVPPPGFKEGDPWPKRDPDPHPVCAEAEKNLAPHVPSPAMVRRASARIQFETVLEPLFRQPLLAVFDDVFLARSDGKVLHTFHQRPGDRDDERPAEVAILNLSSLSARTGWRSSAPLNLKRLRSETGQTDVTLGGTDYVLFTHPYKTEHSLDQSEWIIGGLVAKSRFNSEVLSISASVIVVVVALLIVVIAAWPFLRISLIGRHEALGVGDVLLLGVCTLVQTSIVTLVVLDFIAYQRVRVASDDQMKAFGQRLEKDLTEDVKRAGQALQAFKQWSRVPGTWSSEILGDQKTNPGYLKVLDTNPYATIFSWIDREGMQRYKSTVDRGTPLLRVWERQYFRDALSERYLPGRNFALESIRSLVTGRPETVVATASGAAGLPVVSGTVNLVHVTNAVLPPGYRFAIIDGTGQVLIHSEPQRNGYENFFAETDDNRSVRSAVFARTELVGNVRYWGEDHRVYARPLGDLPWTLVVLRSKSLLRMANTDTLAITLFLLLSHSMLYVIVLVTVLLWNPRYRAPAVWPHEKQAPYYWSLIEVYAGTLIAAAACFYALDPPAVLVIAGTVPAQAIAATYLLLNHDQRRRVFWALAFVVWCIATGVWCYAILAGSAMPGTYVQNWTWAVRIATIAMVVLLGVLTLRQRPVLTPRLSLPRRYVLAGMLFLLISASVPTAGFFKVANRIEIEGLVKYTQLVIAERARAAIGEIEELNGGDSSAESYDVELENDPTQTRWRLVDQPNPNDCGADQRERGESWMHDLLQRVIPAYSEQTVLMRMIHGRSRTPAWQGCRSDNSLILRKPIVLATRNATGEADGPAIKVGKKHPVLEVRSLVPLSFAGFMQFPEDRDERLYYIAGMGTFVLLLAAFAAFVWWVVKFMARRIFLIDVHPPLWLPRKTPPPPPVKPTLGDHIFLVHDSDVDRLTSSADFVDVSLQRVSVDRGWAAALQKIDRSPRGQHVRVTDFESDLGSPGVTDQKLKLLESLLELPDRVIVVASRVTRAYVLASVPAETRPR